MHHGHAADQSFSVFLFDRAGILMESASSLVITLLLGIPAYAAVVDRIAVTVGNQVVTETEVIQEIALTAFLNGEKPVFTAGNKRKAADQLVEQKLVRKEMDMGHYSEAGDDQAKELLAKTAKNLGGEEQMRRELAADGLTESDLEKHLLWQLTLVRFIDLRFRPAIQVTAQDVSDYYQRVVVPKQKPGQAVALADVRDQILQVLTTERADQQLDEWLKHAKTTTRIEYRKEVFQ
jgi:hypothetical protein